MYDNLVKRLRADSDYMDNNGIMLYAAAPFYRECADAIEELSMKLHGDEAAIAGMKREIERMVRAEKPRWVSVTERLPEEDGWYQVYAPNYSGGSSSGLKNINGNMYSAFKHGKWSIEVGYHKRPGCVKAWMPLPEPPKEKNND